MLINGVILVESLGGFQTTFHLLLIVGNPLGVGRHQGMLAKFQAEESILHLLCRHEIVAVNNLLVILVNAGLDFVKFHVHATGHDALSRGTTTLCLPDVR